MVDRKYKLFIPLVLSLFFGLIFSDNTSAFIYSGDLTLLKNSQGLPYSQGYQRISGSWSWSSWGQNNYRLNGNNVAGQPARISGLELKTATNTNVSAQKGDIVVATFLILPTDGGGVDSQITYGGAPNAGQCSMISWDLSEWTIEGISSGMKNYKLQVGCQLNQNITTSVPVPLSLFPASGDVYYLNPYDWAIYRPVNNANIISELEKIYESNLDRNDYLSDILEKLDEINNKSEQDKEEMQESQTEAESSADDSGSEADSTGQTLLGAFGSFVDIISDLNDTGSCLMPSAMAFTIQGVNVNFGRLDFCTDFPLPTTLTSIMSIGMCFVVVGLSIHLVKRLIALFRSFQG